MARAKRERVVQDEVEKANRRPTDPTDSATLTPSLKINHFLQRKCEIATHSLFENVQFSTKNDETEARSLFENEQFPTKICEIEAHVFFEN